MNPAEPAASRSKGKDRNHCSSMAGGEGNQVTAVFLSEIHPCPDGTIKVDHFRNNPPIFFTDMA